ncbi:MAG: PH domain-containing protein, partial [Actinomycetota bacterium]
MGPTLVYRTAVSRVLGYGAVVLAVLAVAFFAATGGVREVLRSGPVITFLALAVWVAFALPHVTVSDGGVTVRNVLRTVHVPWPAFRGVDSTWSLTVRTTAGDVGSWAVPAASGFAARASRDNAGRAAQGVNAN